MNVHQLIESLKWLGYNLGLLALAVLIAIIAHRMLEFVLRRITARTTNAFDDLAIKRSAQPARWIMIVAAVWMAMNLTTFPPRVDAFLRQLISVAFVVFIAWFMIRLIRVGRDLFLSRYNIAVSDNLHARAVHTQMEVIERIVVAVTIVIAFGCVLMTFQGVRQIGVSLLASAGIAGIILGLAAQKVLGTLLAGLQLALTQPIRIEDAVVVEGEFGVIEEITLTYVVIRIWDLRRLVVPMTYFIDKPFQNWTRRSANLLGTVFLYVDAATPIEPIRQELHRLLKESPYWDGKVWALQVTNINEKTAELRALMSASNASTVFDLRCQIREQLLEFVRTNHPAALPRLRVEQTDHPHP